MNQVCVSHELVLTSSDCNKSKSSSMKSRNEQREEQDDEEEC